MAQGGLWDVEGTGLSRIEDKGLALKILERTNAMNKNVGMISIGITLVLAAVPEFFNK